MISRFHRSGRTAARAVAMFGAALLLISQIVGAAHFHEGAASRDGVSAAQLSADPGFCPVCQLALHSPGSVTAATTVARGPAIAGTISLVAPIRSESPVFSAARVRAPPVAL
ncbi:MAG TPA: hypothetical protein VJX68_02715 [Candidatus Binatus sp.]|uniref:hypothetical protein n=1 Tax=Candidatus Binatus sp. TaxID=2811406 RepID=UPI002B483F62|nr:hypothetical protein [Candidatus Binatus sp.]HKN12083.1 hypothetical protein [Candidatus Binatus sp.]